MTMSAHVVRLEKLFNNKEFDRFIEDTVYCIDKQILSKEELDYLKQLISIKVIRGSDFVFARKNILQFVKSATEEFNIIEAVKSENPTVFKDKVFLIEKAIKNIDLSIVNLALNSIEENIGRLPTRLHVEALGSIAYIAKTTGKCRIYAKDLLEDVNI